jgi:hypothetical protein
MGVGGQHHAPTALPPEERPSTQHTGRWVGPRAGRSRPPPPTPPRCDRQTVQPIDSRYTNYTSLAHKN